MIEVTQSGSFANTERYLNKLLKRDLLSRLGKYGSQGVTALSNATPRDTGLTAGSWTYTIVQRAGYYSIRWSNTNIRDGIPIAVLLQYGHATRNGGYVQGRDYINPALRPIFDKIAAEAWEEVTKV